MKRKLLTETDTPKVEALIRYCVEYPESTEGHEHLTHFEHGQWWVTCLCGAIWSVVDSYPGILGKGIDFEQIEHGDEDFHQPDDEDGEL